MLIIKWEGRGVFGCDVRYVWYLRIFFSLKRILRPLSELYAVDRLGRESLVTTGSTHSRLEREGAREADFQGAGRVCRQETAHSTEQPSKGFIKL